PKLVVLDDVARLVVEGEGQPVLALHDDLSRLHRPQVGLGAMIAAELQTHERAVGKGRAHRLDELVDARRGQCRSLVVRNLSFGQSCLARSAHHWFCARYTGAPVRSSAMFIFWAV